MIQNPQAERERKRQIDGRRGSAASRGYNSRWAKARANYLLQHPLCVECRKSGKITPATVVDHVTPHCGNLQLFWDPNNWQGLCKPCHDAKTMRELNERRTGRPSRILGSDASGIPLDPNSPWNK